MLTAAVCPRAAWAAWTCKTRRRFTVPQNKGPGRKLPGLFHWAPAVLVPHAPAAADHPRSQCQAEGEKDRDKDQARGEADIATTKEAPAETADQVHDRIE